MTYTVTRHQHGIAFTGDRIPASDLWRLMEGYMYEFETADAKISKHLGAIMVLTSQEKSVIWRKELGIGDDK